MKFIREILRKHNRLAVCLSITVLSLILTGTLFIGALPAALNAVKELWGSFLAYIGFLLFMRLPLESPIAPPSDQITILPSVPAELGETFRRFFSLFISSENFLLYLKGLEDFLLVAFRVLPLVIMAIFLLRKYIKGSF